MLKIKLHKNFIKSFEKLDNEHKTKVIEFLENLKGSESVKKIT
jgi:mRNA-degrading endonuclease RelE of RelBE toxin-antitoxin system